MQAEIITIGDELLIGDTVDTNSAFIGQLLTQVGIRVFQKTSISDNAIHITETLTEASNRSDLIIITGGLGPTSDDITKTTLCEYFETTLIPNADVLADITELLAQREKKLLPSNVKQADVPANCIALRNKVGTAPGMWFEKNDTFFISLPGVPTEVKHLMTEQVMPRLSAEINLPVIGRKMIYTTGMSEAMLSQTLEKWEKALPPKMKIAYLPSPGVNKIRLNLTGTNAKETQAILEAEAQKVAGYIPGHVFGYDDDTIEKVVAKLLIDNKKTVSTAESCTGGTVAAMLTSLSGSSAYFKGSVVAYANEVKQNVLGVSEQTLIEHGAVSKQAVEEMAVGVRKLLSTDYAVAVSGIAGPNGATPDKPVGTVWIAVASADTVQAKLFNMGNERQKNIQKAAIAALNMLRLTIG